ncbi:TadE-like protein [Arthrobacter sp. SLBN-100]|uniref:TadE family protein n=1 Tax=Arthrobacter sp. SLBN-100 TaxID=2768450 RepID=UPI00114E2027|nr:TadE family protein [Arthrobacter sp. SLBN-100]TQJ67154.1 TadE-like protein [Arthrobacter sp. SLBN-100]
MTPSTRGGNTNRALDSGQNHPAQGDEAGQEAEHLERGSAVVDFVLVGSLLTVFFLAIIQLALVLHVRNTLIDAAASGARYGTLADRNAADAEDRTRSLIQTALNAGFAEQVSTSEATYQGLRTLEVTVRAPMPVIGLIGPRDMLEVKGHAALQP